MVIHRVVLMPMAALRTLAENENLLRNYVRTGRDILLVQAESMGFRLEHVSVVARRFEGSVALEAEVEG